MNKIQIAKQLVAISKVLLSYKDVDQIHDTGGKVDRKDSDRPGRDDLKKHKQNIRKMPKEDRGDFEQVSNDKDLKLSQSE